MAYSAVSDTLVEVGKSTKREIFTGLNSNQADHETRVSSLETGAAKVIVFDEVIELDRARAGEVKFSFLTEAQFQAKYGVDWVLIDGGSIAGTDLASLYGATLPDATTTGRFPRILGGALSIGDLQANQNLAHTHNLDDSNGIALYTQPGGGGGGSENVLDTNPAVDPGAGTVILTTETNGGTEARPDSLVLNAFTRKNDYEIDQAKLFKAPFAFNFTSAIVTTLVAGASGTLENDVKIGATLGSLSTVFSTKPSVAQASGANASSSNAVFNSNAVAASDWIQIDITALQVNQHRYHLLILGELT